MSTNMAGKIFSFTGPLLRKKFERFAVSRWKSDSSAVTMLPNIEISFNAQINAELFAGYTYLAMANYFGRQCVALPGCHMFYMKQVEEEQRHAKKLMDFVVQRGGNITLQPVMVPSSQEWDSPLSAFKEALNLEVDITQKLLNLHEECDNCSDQFGCNLIENDFLGDQIESIDIISRYIAQLERIGCDALATYIFDQYLLSEWKQGPNN